MAQTDGDKTPRKLRRLYKFRDGEINGKLTADVTGVVWETIVGGHRVECELAKLFPAGLPEPCIGLMATAFGMNTVVGNAIAGKEGTPEELAAKLQDRLEAIEEGDWAEGREGGPRLKYILEAWATDARNRGKNVTEESIATVKAKILSGEWTGAGLLDNAGIRAAYDAAEAQRVVAKAQKSQEAAAAAKPTSSFDV